MAETAFNAYQRLVGFKPSDVPEVDMHDELCHALLQAAEQDLRFWVDQLCMTVEDLFSEPIPLPAPNLLPGFVLAACIGPAELHFYCKCLVRVAFPNQTVNLQDFADRMVSLYASRYPTPFKIEPSTFQSLARQQEIDRWG